MLASITPLGERGRGNRYTTTVAWHLAGALVGGALAGLLAGAAGSVVPLSDRVATEGAIAVVLLAFAFDARLGGLRLPTVRRQVNERWLDRYRAWVYGAGFGFQLGTGIATIVTTAATYAWIALSVLAGDGRGGAAIGAVFGTVRGASVLAAARVRTPAQLVELHRRIANAAPIVRRASLGVYVIGVVVAAVALAA